MGDSSDRDRKSFPDSSRAKAEVEPTIVGGRPLTRGQLLKGIPRGIEVLIKKASVDREFRAILLEKRAEAAAEIELDLSATETGMLNAVPRAQIEKIIGSTTVPTEHRRVFLGRAAAAMLAVLCLPVTAAAWEFSMGCRFESRLKYFGRLGGPLGPPAISVDEKEDRLGLEFVSEGKDFVDVSVHYNCPHDLGEIEIMFRDADGRACPFIKTVPLRACVSRGRGDVRFYAQGTRGTTEWLVIRLGHTVGADEEGITQPFLGSPDQYPPLSPRNILPDSAEHPPIPSPPPERPASKYINRELHPLWPPDNYRTGEYKDGNRAVYRVEKFLKTWRPGMVHRSWPPSERE